MITNDDLKIGFIQAAKQGGTAIQVMERFYAEFPTIPRKRMQTVAREVSQQALKSRQR